MIVEIATVHELPTDLERFLVVRLLVDAPASSLACRCYGCLNFFVYTERRNSVTDAIFVNLVDLYISFFLTTNVALSM